jgi:hypothetical protein
MSRIVRLSESNLNKFIKKVVKEQIAMGSDENMSTNPMMSMNGSTNPNFKCQKQTSRPFCSKMVTSKTIGGKMIPLEGSVFMMVTDESGCPKLCKVQGEIYKLV